jgi:hypothetical protein
VVSPSPRDENWHMSKDGTSDLTSQLIVTLASFTSDLDITMYVREMKTCQSYNGCNIEKTLTMCTTLLTYGQSLSER